MRPKGVGKEPGTSLIITDLQMLEGENRNTLPHGKQYKRHVSQWRWFEFYILFITVRTSRPSKQQTFEMACVLETVASSSFNPSKQTSSNQPKNV